MSIEEQKYTVELTGKQLYAIRDALEEYFRIRLGQYSDLADDITKMSENLDPQNPNYKKSFDDYISRREYAKMAYDTAYKIATDDGFMKGYHISSWTETSSICHDIWHVIREKLYRDYMDSIGKDADKEFTVITSPLVARSDEPLITVNKE